MKRPKSKSLHDLQGATETIKPAPVFAPAPTRPVVKPIVPRSRVALTQNILYRSTGGKQNLIRPGHKLIPRGSVGVVTAIVAEDHSYDVAFQQPVIGVLRVDQTEIKHV